MKSATSLKLRYFALGAAVMLVLEGLAHLVAAHAQTLPPAGEIPRCFGRTATHVLVNKAKVDYSAWEAAGVIVVDTRETDGDLTGTTGQDVLVSLVSTRHNGIFGTAKWRAKPADGGATAGDYMCQKKGPGIFYGTPFADHMMSEANTGDTVEDYYLGGCRLAPKNVRSDHAPSFWECDEAFTGPGMDKIWGSFVPAGYHQHIASGTEQDHNYVGAGRGQVEVVASFPTRRAVCPATGPCKPGDHIHPCRGTKGLMWSSVEFVGSESVFLADRFVADPCAYDFQNIG